MPSLELFIAFGLAATVLMLTPGPNVAVIAATGAAHGRQAALTVVLGATLAQGLQIALVVGGLAALLAAFNWALTIVKWAGVAYLAWMGLSALLGGYERGEVKPVSSNRLFFTGAVTALANPKTLMFHAAFLPLFVNPAAPAGPQLVLLGALFLTIALIVDGGYALLAGGLRPWLARAGLQHVAQRGSGALMLVAAGWLAARRVE